MHVCVAKGCRQMKRRKRMNAKRTLIYFKITFFFLKKVIELGFKNTLRLAEDFRIKKPFKNINKLHITHNHKHKQ